MTLREAMRATGLTRRQLRYLEDKSHLGFVARIQGRTAYSPSQAEFLETFARLRLLELSIDEAARIAGECRGAEVRTPPERVLELAERALAQVKRHSRVAAE